MVKRKNAQPLGTAGRLMSLSAHSIRVGGASWWKSLVTVVDGRLVSEQVCGVFPHPWDRQPPAVAITNSGAAVTIRQFERTVLNVTV